MAANKQVPMATNQHTTTEEMLEAVFSVVCAMAVAMQWCGKHSTEDSWSGLLDYDTL
jgi:hypothetical protein